MKLLMGEPVNKQEYLNQLKYELKDLPSVEVEDIIRDQEEYFREAINSGRSEDQIIQSLGSPAQLAKEVKAEYRVKMATEENKVFPKAKSIFKAILALCVLAPFNLIIVLGPFVLLCSLLLTMWSVGLSFIFASGAVIIAGPAAMLMLNPLLGIGLFFAGVTALGVSLLFTLLAFYITSWALKWTVSYLKWNVDIISSQAKSVA